MFPFIPNANLSAAEIAAIKAQHRQEITFDLQVFHIINLVGLILLSMQIIYSLFNNWVRMNKLMRCTLIMYNLMIIASFAFHLVISLYIDEKTPFSTI